MRLCLVAGCWVGLASVLDAPALDAWGWRAALLLGACIVPFGLMMRRRLDETLTPTVREDEDPARGSYRRSGGIGPHTVERRHHHQLPARIHDDLRECDAGNVSENRLRATAVIGLSGLVCDSLGGWLSDHFGRKPIMIIPWVFLALAGFPTFRMLDHLRTGAALYIACGLLGSLSTLSSATIIGRNHRVAAPAGALRRHCLDICTGHFGFRGSAQFLVAVGDPATGNPLAPAWYMFCGVMIGLLALIQLPETATAKVGLRRPCCLMFACRGRPRDGALQADWPLAQRTRIFLTERMPPVPRRVGAHRPAGVVEPGSERCELLFQLGFCKCLTQASMRPGPENKVPAGMVRAADIKPVRIGIQLGIAHGRQRREGTAPACAARSNHRRRSLRA